MGHLLKCCIRFALCGLVQQSCTECICIFGYNAVIPVFIFDITAMTGQEACANPDFSDIAISETRQMAAHAS
jgi:hypothetical protein